jgi:hypothetical protein
MKASTSRDVMAATFMLPSNGRMCAAIRLRSVARVLA